MVPFRPIEANNNGQMVPRAESIWEGNYTNAAVARNANQMLTTALQLLQVVLICCTFRHLFLVVVLGEGDELRIRTKWLIKCTNE